MEASDDGWTGRWQGKGKERKGQMKCADVYLDGNKTIAKT